MNTYSMVIFLSLPIGVSGSWGFLVFICCYYDDYGADEGMTMMRLLILFGWRYDSFDFPLLNILCIG